MIVSSQTTPLSGEIKDILSSWLVDLLGKRVKYTTRMGFEPMRAEHNGLAVHHLNHSATLSYALKKHYNQKYWLPAAKATCKSREPE